MHTHLALVPTRSACIWVCVSDVGHMRFAHGPHAYREDDSRVEKWPPLPGKGNEPQKFKPAPYLETKVH